MTLTDKNPQIISKMFDNISNSYDRNNNIISLGIHKIIKRLAIKLLNLSDNQKIIDICCGTGDISEILSKTPYQLDIYGIDFSEKMIFIAKKKFPSLKFEIGDATNLNILNSSIDIITMTFGLRNIDNRSKAIKEAYRILKPNGQFLHLDFGYKNIFSKIFDIIALIGIRALYKNTAPYSYLIKSKREFPDPDKLIEEFTSEGFKLMKKKEYLFGIISAQVYYKQ